MVILQRFSRGVARRVATSAPSTPHLYRRAAGKAFARSGPYFLAPIAGASDVGHLTSTSRPFSSTTTTMSTPTTEKKRVGKAVQLAIDAGAPTIDPSIVRLSFLGCGECAC